MTNQQCNTSRIAGVQFTLYPMSDNFVDILLSALDEVDQSKVWKETDDVTTCVRGKIVHIFDVTKAIFLHAAKTGEHVAMTGTYSIGCPGDNEADVYMAESDAPVNAPQLANAPQRAGCKFAIHPLGREDYMDKIYEQIDLSKARGVDVSAAHYMTRLDGDVQAIFDAIQDAFEAVQQEVSHTTMTFTISANSPSNK
ncbi:YkoF family thiamine/hydroxymethylpyrimidine-binding protein [Alkalibacillus sp. S2W]|uniref:YkoF family thiamine/hydroxymethylpyrimidine-binding protein n=1 Tax=Alkalibacillus sp. S2W TaxID=3386553 RepID=UPI00398CD477